MPNLLPGSGKYSSNKLLISMEITSELCLISRYALNLCYQSNRCFACLKSTSQFQLKDISSPDPSKRLKTAIQLQRHEDKQISWVLHVKEVEKENRKKNESTSTSYRIGITTKQTRLRTV